MKNSTRLGCLLSLAAAGALSLPAGIAEAAPDGGSAAAYTCAGGDIPPGTYSSVTVTGDCAVPAHATVNITGNLSVLQGATFDAASAPSDITVGHNVTGSAGSTVSLGCTAGHGGCDLGNPESGPGLYAGESSNVLVMGNISLSNVFNAALNGITVNGNISSAGGGAGTDFPGFIPFSVKDDTIHGNLTVNGLSSSWFGVIRTSVDGNVTLNDINVADPDGNEIVHDTIGNNLTCHSLSPAGQLGDAVFGHPAGYPYSTVGGTVSSECAFVLAP